MAIAETEDEARTLLEAEYERQNEGLDTFENPFHNWTNEILEEILVPV